MSALVKFIPQLGLSLAKYSGKQVVDRLGIEVIQETIASVLCGYNIRSFTERLTRRRLTLSNCAMVKTFVDAVSSIDSFETNLTSILKKELQTATKSERKLFLSWIAGLTKKTYVNVTRGDTDNLEVYLDTFKESIEKAAKVCKDEFGDISGQIKINNSVCMIDWLLISYLASAIGSQTLSIRGSEKSLYGKMFEPLILSTLLKLLGFEQIAARDTSKSENVFWLSDTNKRECDATLLYKLGQGVFFDIGFICSGNPEITLDKVTRFESHLEKGTRSYEMSTIIIVDRIGERSSIIDLAKEVNGHIIQMSMSHWTKELAVVLNKLFGYENQILKLKAADLESYIRDNVKRIQLFNA